jgi:SAM-dependent methyltransferase
MGDRNQLLFVKQNASLFEGPFLEIGSRDYGDTQNLRALFAPRGHYIGIDALEGAGVDRVLDLTQPIETISAALDGQRFGTIFCMSVMEHCRQPFAMADAITQLLKPGGVLCLSVPFAWQFHGYPSDYWRFTHEGVKQLFPALVFNEALGHAALRDSEFNPLDTEIGKVALSTSLQRKAGKAGRAVGAGFLKMIGRTPAFGWALGHPYLLAPTMINMIGRNPAA